MRRIVALLLFCLLPLLVLSVSADELRGQTGELSWVLDDSGTLTISGEGKTGAGHRPNQGAGKPGVKAGIGDVPGGIKNGTDNTSNSVKNAADQANPLQQPNP